MIPTSHLLAGLIIAGSLELTGIEMNLLLVSIAVLSSLAHDLDGFFVDSLTDHHDSILHSPFLWIAISLSIFLAGFPEIALVTGISGLFHILSDYITALTVGVKLFYPLNNRMYSLCKVRPGYGSFDPSNPDKKELKKYFRLYWEKRPVLIFEIFVNFAGMVSLIYLLI